MKKSIQDEIDAFEGGDGGSLCRHCRIVLTKIMYGEHVDDTFLPCVYLLRYEEGQDAA